MIKNKKVLILLAIIILGLLIAGLVYISRQSKTASYSYGNKTNTTNNHKPTSPNNSPTNNQAANTQTGKSLTSGSSTTGTGPATPTGNFVSNHNPNPSDPRQQNEISVCYTTVGAYCNIQFDNGSSIISLGKLLVGSNGYVTWNWNINNLGLFPGKWTITAIATLNGQTKSSVDQLPLTVQ